MLGWTLPVTVRVSTARVLLGLALVGSGSGLSALEETASEPSLDSLIEINSPALIGTQVEVSTDLKISLKFKGDGLFNRVFQSRSPPGKGFLSKVDDAKGTLPGQKLIDKAEDVFSVIGVDSGSAQTNFELADDWKISFLAKIPSLVPASSFVIRVNQEDGKNFLQTSFFQNILAMQNGRKNFRMSPHKDLQAEPLKWFDKKGDKGVPVEIVFKDKKLSIFMTLSQGHEGRREGRKEGGREGRKERRKEGGKERRKDGGEEGGKEKVEVVSLEGIDKPAGGKVVFVFQKLSFLIGDLSIEGKLSRSWAEEAIAKLRAEGKLQLKKAEKPAERDVASGAKKAAKKGEKTSIDAPDPEAEDDL